MASMLRSIFGSLFRTIHTLWLEVMGTLFLVFALMFGVYAVQAYRRYSAFSDPSGLWMIGSAAALSVLTLGFGIHSFWKARKLR
jgi:uncharacterized membrane protein